MDKTGNYDRLRRSEVSHGTLRPVDLLDSFTDALEKLESFDQFSPIGERAKRYCPQLIKRSRGLYTALEYCENEDIEPSERFHENVGETIYELTDALNVHAFEYCYFGAHAGDGSAFGFWPDIDYIRDAISSDELPIDVYDNAEMETYEGHHAHVNDHGNITVYYRHYDGHDTEIVSIV